MQNDGAFIGVAGAVDCQHTAGGTAQLEPIANGGNRDAFALILYSLDKIIKGLGGVAGHRAKDPINTGVIQCTGNAANVVDNAVALCDYYMSELAEVSALLAMNTAEQPVVYITGTSSYLTTAPGQMYQSSLITSAAGTAAGADIEGNSWVEISYEQLLTMNPDVIVVPTNSMANAPAEYPVEDLLNDPQLSEVTAIKNGAVYQMTTGFEAWDSPAPSGVLGVKWMVQTLHPELYSTEDFAADVQEFYQTFYGFTPDTAAITG